MILTPAMHQLTIQKKDLRVEKLNLDEPFAWAQKQLVAEIERQYNQKKPVRIIVLKGRQLGISTASEGVLFNWTFLHPGTRSLVIAHESKAAQHLFDMTKLMWEEWWARDLYTEKHNTIKTLSWAETRSSMSVATARNAGSGRSFTYHAVHCSECAFWDEPERLMVGLNQSVPFKHGTVMILESTANGVGNWFHQEWERAETGESEFIPMFFPWFNHMEYQFPGTSLRTKDYTKPERELAKLYHLTPGHIAWRRHAIKNLCLNDEKQFQQEYPCTPDEAFLSTGYHVFPLQKLEECFDEQKGTRGLLANNNGKISFIRDTSGPLTIFKAPGSSSRSKYVIGADPSYTTQGDGACAQVINRYTLEQVAVFHGQLDPVMFAHQLMMLGYYYNEALLNVEIEGPGHGTGAVILDHGYPNLWKHRWFDRAPGKVSTAFFWSTNYQRKQLAIGKVTWLLGQNSLIIHDRKTFQQFQGYISKDNGDMGPADWKDHDDAVMAFAIAVVSTLTEGPLDYSDTPDVQSTPNDLFNEPPWRAFEVV